jgi:hypothetical protein
MTYRCVGKKNQRQTFTETNEHLKPKYKKYSGFKQNSIPVESPDINYKVPYWSFLIIGFYFTMLILYGIKQLDDSE